MKSLNGDKARHLRVRAVVAYPVVTVALVVSIALALTPFGTTQVMALVPSPALAAATADPSPTTTAGPSPTTTANPSPTTTADPTSTPSPTPLPSPSTQVFSAPGNHHVLARIEGSQMQANYLPVDEPVVDALPHQRFRVRFRLRNPGTVATTTTPRLEYRAEGAADFVVVPTNSELGSPMYAAQEWIPSLDLLGGTMLGPLGADIPLAELRMGADGTFALSGHRSMGANPDQPITLLSDSYTEEEFTVQLTADAQYLTGYELRITDGGTALTGTDVAVIRLGGVPAVVPEPGVRQGIAVVDPVVPTSPAAIAYPLVTGIPSAATAAPDSIHGPYSLATDTCAVCHRAHTAQAPNLLVKGSQSDLCFTCHNATGAAANVQAEYALARPANDPVARDYYSHDAIAPSKHTRSSLDEFGGVSNRHSSCADCHNTHKATISAAGSIQTTDGWDASGRLAGVSGVSVVNGAAGTAPTYTFLSGSTDAANDADPLTNANPITREYQLCFKCHSGFTKLPAPIAGKPSKDALDKGVEFNPANPSFHPIEAAGKNQTAKMTASLAGPSPYKMWDFNATSTVRCLNCHTSGTTPDTTSVPLPLPGSALQPHTSSNRGILLKNYRDRLLATTNAAYNNADFALCYTCHSNTPFASESGGTDRTNFRLHGYHTAKLAGMGSSITDIDTPGAGGGNAICAECHFRLHSTTNKVGAQVIDGTRLVNFAPNVTPNDKGVISWTRSATGGGTCALKCHNVNHDAKKY